MSRCLCRLGTWVVVFFSCSTAFCQTANASRIERFEDEMKALQKAFQIPGLAVLIRENGNTVWEGYLGHADLELKRSVTQKTQFPIASVSKTFAAVLVMQQVEKGRLSLEDPVVKWLPKKNIPPSAKLKHLLSHTSEGDPGSLFLYSARYAWLGAVLEKATGRPYEDLMRESILVPLAMTDTLPGLGPVGSKERVPNLATGYLFDGQLEATDPPRGLNAANGLVTTARDLATFDAALDTHKLISKSSFAQMRQPFRSPKGQNLEYGFGMFVQSIQGETVLWAYGQEDAFSSLFLKVPHRQLSLILLANNNLLSDPARLIQGHLLRSRFALSFLRHFIFSHQIAAGEEAFQEAFFQREEKIAQVLQDTFFASYTQNMTQMQQGGKRLTSLIQTHPELLETGDMSLRHACSMFPPDLFPEIARFTQNLDKRLAQRLPNMPYLLYYQAELEDMLGRPQEAVKLFQTMADLPNHVDNWYRLEAFNKLGQYYASRNAQLARRYYQRLAGSRWNYRGLPKRAKAWLAANPAKE